MNSTTQTFFGLTQPVFTRPSKRPYLDPAREKVMAKLRALVARRGFALLTAAPGCGKTVMLHYLATEVNDNKHKIVYIPHTFLEKGQMLAFICTSMGLEPCHSMPATLHAIQKHVAEIQPVNVVFVIDEIERVESSTTTIIRLIANDRPDTVHQCTLILAGTDRFIDQKLRLHVNEPLRQRITLYLQLKPLTMEHTAEYIAHQLRQAGAAADLFDPAALQLIHELSGGVPRVVNKLAEAAIDVAAEQQVRTVTIEHVETGAETALPPSFQEALP